MGHCGQWEVSNILLYRILILRISKCRKKYVARAVTDSMLSLITRYDAMTRTYYRGAKAAVVCYDMTKSSTFQRAKHWVRELRSIEENCKVYLCATKKDLCDEGFVSDDPDMQNIVERYASGTQTKLFITSSKTGENIGEEASDLVLPVSFAKCTYRICLLQLNCSTKL